MSGWLVGHARLLAEGAAKAALMYFVALLGLRVAHRRTLAQWTAIDFAAAVAIGAVMGRTAVASGQSFALGAVVLATFLAAHTVAIFLRFHPLLAKVTDHRVRVLVAHGTLRPWQLVICGLTENDLLSQLRTLGHTDLRSLPVVPDRGQERDDPIVSSGLRDAAGYA
jgi:uncharacterized membrane protein YcaP (DUF421 family)